MCDRISDKSDKKKNGQKKRFAMLHNNVLYEKTTCKIKTVKDDKFMNYFFYLKTIGQKKQL